MENQIYLLNEHLKILLLVSFKRQFGTREKF